MTLKSISWKQGWFTTILTLALLMSSNSETTTERRHNDNLRVDGLSVEYESNPIGIDVLKPRFAWKLSSNERNIRQTAYQIQVSLEETSLEEGKNIFWNSEKVLSDDSVHQEYKGPAPGAKQRYYWRVRVWDQDDSVTAWSRIHFWEMGLLNPDQWRAQWIEPNVVEDASKSNPSPMLRREFRLKREILSARAYVSSHGLYEMFLNGKQVGDKYFTPGWTSYNKRLQYQVYDVTDLLRRKDNAVSVLLGDGWYRGNLVWDEYRNIYGDSLALIMQINVTYEDGHEELVISDENWKSSTGPIRMSEIYHGEIYDARLEKKGWRESGYDDSQWNNVKVVKRGKNKLVASSSPAVQKIEEREPVQIITTPEGDTVLDMGQNMVGWVKFKVEGQKGDTVTLRHAEALDKNGNFYTDNLRSAKQTVSYTLKGEGGEEYEPHFTFQGFRYVAVDNYPGRVSKDNFTGVVLHSNMPQQSSFETSKPMVNQLQRNILWTQKGNFLEVPTDCPQRDERLGWTGDAQVFIRTAAFNMNVAGFFTKWLRDLKADQKSDGAVPHIIPDVVNDKIPFSGSAAWGDAAVIIPWTLYLVYGDVRLLAEQYESMKNWVEFEKEKAGYDLIWSGSDHFGDWLAFSSERPDYPGATTSKDYIATAFFAHSVDLLSKTARVLGRNVEAEEYARLFEDIKISFMKEYVSENGRIAENTQTAYALALEFNLLPELIRPVAAGRLAEEVRNRKHLTTGFVGTPYLVHALSRYGYLEEAYMLLNRVEYPSWLYPVSQGATTIWERWDGQKPDGSFQTTAMNSFNHYAYGAIGDWMYRVMAGLEVDTDEPGYKHILIQPKPGGGFDHVSLGYESMYGKITVSWKKVDDKFNLEIQIPPNSRATVTLPNASRDVVNESGFELNKIKEVSNIKHEGDAVTLTIGSGEYKFSYPLNGLGST